MTEIFEQLYLHLIGSPDPRLWPEHLRGDLVNGHGKYCFYHGLCLGLQLATEAFHAETEL